MSEVTSPADEVVRICQELIRIDSTNYGDGSGRASGQLPTTWSPSSVRSGSNRPCLRASRANVGHVRLEGQDRERPALCVHGHLDVVPADAADWQVDRSAVSCATAASGVVGPST
jgi:acetylornithine deacetylase/succinyl-diaminopimelate desuccinylase-like protein